MKFSNSDGHPLHGERIFLINYLSLNGLLAIKECVSFNPTECLQKFCSSFAVGVVTINVNNFGDHKSE